MKKTHFLVFILLGLTTSLSAMDANKIYELESVRYKKNNFGDILPLWEEIPLENLNEQLSFLVNSLKDKIQGTPFIINVPHNKAAALDHIRQAGFVLHHANNDKTEWIFKNGSSIPEPYSSVIAASVIVKKEDEILIIEEKTRRGALGFPGGTANFREFPCITAARECKEEVNLNMNPNTLQLLAITNRICVNRYGANGAHYYYIIDSNDTKGELEIDLIEIVRAFFVPLKDIAEQPSVEGLKVTPFYAALAKHILDGRIQSRSAMFNYDRQLSEEESMELYKKAADRDLRDIMTVEFIG